MVSFNVDTKLTRRSRPLLINVGAKSTRQHNGCNIYYNKRWLHAAVATSVKIRLCQHTDDKSPIQSTMVWLGRHHLAFAVAK